MCAWAVATGDCRRDCRRAVVGLEPPSKLKVSRELKARLWQQSAEGQFQRHRRCSWNWPKLRDSPCLVEKVYRQGYNGPVSGVLAGHLP